MSLNEYGNWELIPHQGLGKIRFGMSREEVASFNSIYGEAELIVEKPANMQEFLEDLGPFADDLSEEEKADLQDDWGEEDKDCFTEFRHGSDLRFYYRNNKLVDICALPCLGRLTFRGQELFELEAEKMVVLLVDGLGEVPLGDGGDLAFPGACVYLNDFTSVGAGFIYFTDDYEDNYESEDEDETSPLEQTLSWTDSPRNEEEDFAEYIKIDPRRPAAGKKE